MSYFDVSHFKRDKDFYGKIDLLLTVKSFDLQAIRKRYLDSKKRKSGRAGSVTRREPGMGGLTGVTLKSGKAINEQVLWKAKEPRGIDYKHGRLAISAENEVYVVDEGGATRTLRHDWFSYIHTVAWSPFDNDRLLISSSGLDILHEFDVQSEKPTFEWLAWEHGFPTGLDPEVNRQVVLTRNKQEASRMEEAGLLVKLIENPANTHLPTAMRAAFINSVTYDPIHPDQILATFFHEGAVYGISRKSGLVKPLLKGLKNPHGGRRDKSGLMATSTGTGKVYWKRGGTEHVFDLSNLPGKPEELGEMEWVQNTGVHGEFWIAIDSNRTSFVAIDPENQLFDLIPYDSNWAVQDMIPGFLTKDQEAALKAIK